ncbi:MAG TPA: transporter substrate-binding domain-containing protein [Methanospirillum sp.]|nr:transporter substrate-binding domain-containing protein [Methanospirillum sp.]
MNTPIRVHSIILILILVLLSVDILSASSDTSSHPAILVRADNRYPPYEFLDADGNPAGFNIDLFRAVAEAMDINATIHPGPWNEVRSELENGTIDMLTGMYYSAERAQRVYFSTPYIVVSHAVFVRKGSGIRDPDEIWNRSVIVQSGDIMHDFALAHTDASHIIPVENQADALTLLSSGRYDCALLGKLQALYHAEKLKIDNIEIIGPSIEPRNYCFAVSAQNENLLGQLNEGLAIIKQSGTYDTIYQKWFGVYEEKQAFAIFYPILLWFIIPLGGVILLIIFWNWLLKRQVTRKTVDLQRELAHRHEVEAALRESESQTKIVHEDLHTAYEQLAAAEEELRHNYDELGRNKAELQRINTILKTQQDTSFYGILVIGTNREILYYNQRFITIWDIQPGIAETKSDELVLQSVLDKLVHPDVFLSRVQELYAHPDENSFDEVHLKGGITLERYSSPVIGPDSTSYGRVWYFLDITERKMAEDALSRTTKKLNLLNAIAFSDIQNAVFSLSGYLEMEKEIAQDEALPPFLPKEIALVRIISESLKFANYYQNLGLKPPRWQNVHQCFLFGISHLDISHISRDVQVESLEIFADPLLENVFFTFAENLILHGKTVTSFVLSYCETPDGLILSFEDNGIGIVHEMKEKIFERQYEEKKGIGLFLTREILSITGMTIQETGEPGNGARFEILVPKGVFRFIKNDES